MSCFSCLFSRRKDVSRVEIDDNATRSGSSSGSYTLLHSLLLKISFYLFIYYLLLIIDDDV